MSEPGISLHPAHGRITGRLAIDAHEEAPGSQGRTDAPVERRLRGSRPDVMQRKRRDHRVARRQRRAQECPGGERGTVAKAPRSHGQDLGVDVDADDPRARSDLQTPRRQRAGADAEVHEHARPRWNGCGRYVEHLVVVGDERADPPVVFRESDAEMRRYAHGRSVSSPWWKSAVAPRAAMRPVDHPSAAAALGAPNAGGLPLRAASRLVPTTESYGQRRISRECGILYRQRAEIERGSP